MATRKEAGLIEITEDAYKQNSVYRPWDEIKASGMTMNSGTSLTQQQALKALAAISEGLALTAIPG